LTHQWNLIGDHACKVILRVAATGDEHLVQNGLENLFKLFSVPKVIAIVQERFAKGQHDEIPKSIGCSLAIIVAFKAIDGVVDNITIVRSENTL
jgi:hypothetical protein